MFGLTTDQWLSILAIVALICVSGFFSGSETALTAASRARMQQLNKNGDRKAGIVARLIKVKEKLIGALLLGNNLVNILASALATSLFLNLFGEAGVAYATLVMTLVVVVFAEVLPKSWAIANPDKFALAVSPVVRVIVFIFAPITAIITSFVQRVLKLLGVDTENAENVLSGSEELRGTVDLMHEEGAMVKTDRDRVGGVLDLHDLEVTDVMVHRTEMMSINLDASAEENVEAILKSPFTRIPLWQGDSDNIVGILHAKSVFRAVSALGGDPEKISLKEVANDPWFVPDTTSLQDQLNAFLRKKEHLAIVVDEYGEMQGLVTLEDILEEIVGEIADEHDIDLKGVQPQTDGSLIVEGGVPIRDINRAMDWNLPDEEATTIAGLVIHEAQAIPNQNQQFTFHGLRLRVLKKNRNRITQLRVTPVNPPRN